MPLINNQPLMHSIDEKKRRVVIIRHGATLMNLEKEQPIRGWLDISLAPEGFEQAEKLGRKLKDSGIDMLVASDLTRTLQTAVCVSRESDIPILATTMAMRPWNVGKYTGVSAKEAHPILFKMAVEEPDKSIPEGESFNSFRYRVLTGMIAFLNEYPDKTIAFVAHHRNDRILRAWYEAGCPDDFEVDMSHFGQHGIDPGTADILEIESSLLV